MHSLAEGPWLAAIPAAIAVSCACHRPPMGSVAPAPSEPPRVALLPDDGMVDVGGHRVHVHCVGDGTPPVVIDGCFGCDGTTWGEALPAIGAFTRVCAYDRAGAGYSDPISSSRGLEQRVTELGSLLAGVPTPAVLLGQGLGGIDAQVYASAHPREVAGVVLVDSVTRDYDTRYWDLYPPEPLQALRDEFRRSGEHLDLDREIDALARIRRGPLSLGDRPLVVLNRGQAWPPEPGISVALAATLERSWQEMQSELAGLSSNSTHIVADGVGWIPSQASNRVVDAARDVVLSVRKGVPLLRASLDPAPPSPPPTHRAPAQAPVTERGASFADGLVDVGDGLAVHVHCMGSGDPPVMMEAGRGTSGSSWRLVQPEIARQTRVCVYDRAGIGYSERPSEPRSVRQAIQELHALLGALKFERAVVLVGHSIGGLYVRLYAVDYPGEIGGMVLVDGSTEDEYDRIWNLFPADALARLEDPDHEDIRLEAIRAAMVRLRDANRSLGATPLVVLTAGQWEAPPPGVSPELNARQAEIWQELQAALPQWSSNSTQVVAAKSHHFIQLEAPKLVVAAVDEVISSMRTGAAVTRGPLESALGEH